MLITADVCFLNVSTREFRHGKHTKCLNVICKRLDDLVIDIKWYMLRFQPHAHRESHIQVHACLGQHQRR
jgi:hypothetical protein